MSEKRIKIVAPKGKLGVLLIGLGAVSTTFIAGVEAIKKGLGEAVGSLTQMGTVRLIRSTAYPQAANASFRWGDATATTRLISSISRRPSLWLIATSPMPKCWRNSPAISASFFSAMGS